MTTVELEAEPPPPPPPQSPPAQSFPSAQPPAPEDDSADRTPCPLCSRKFLSDRLDKHITICQKLKEKKRKTFDAAKMRAENLDKINLVPTELVFNKPPTPPAAQKSKTQQNSNKAGGAAKKKPTAAAAATVNGKKSNWRAQHDEFIRNIRAARGEEVPEGEGNSDDESGGGNGSRSKSLPPGMVECPSCGRRFSERASDRHIAWCAEKAATEEAKRRNSRDHEDQQKALERMKARTKYKPPTLASNGGGGGGSSNGSLNGSRTSLSKSKSTQNINSTSSSRKSTADTTVSTATSHRTSASSTTSKQVSKNSRAPPAKRAISKSTESLNHKAAAKSPPKAGVRNTTTTTNSNSSGSRASTRTPVNTSDTHSQNPNQRMQRNSDTQRTMVVGRRSTGAHSNVQSKINTGRSPASPTKPKSSAPVMKFKEKFPNHQPTNACSQAVDFEVLRRNSAYDDSPKTVPGVRTGGISPVKSNTTTNGSNGSSLSRSEVNLHRIGGDIKQRIDMYISGLYDNEVINQYADNFQNFISEHFKGGRRGGGGGGGDDSGKSDDPSMMMTEEELLEAYKQQQREMMTGSVVVGGGGSGSKKSSSGSHRRSHSIASDLDARGSTSDSADSGLGVIFGTSEPIKPGSLPMAEILSPPMSELERRSRLMLRNGSLNDIQHLMGQQDGGGGANITVMTALTGGGGGGSKSAHEGSPAMMMASSEFEGDVDLPPPELTPRFCHSCGTKYPNTLAKFCYECGSRRYSTTVEH